MPLSFSSIGNGAAWSGSAWTVSDEQKLASLIARIALGQSRQVERILHDTGFKFGDHGETAAIGAKNLLSVPSGKKPYHRDGWLFQAISWIAAHKQNAGAIIRAPQMIQAHKGFDGIHVELDAKTGRVTRIVVCEEKATDGPRGVITSKVWKEFRDLETGRRDNELVAEVSQMLAAQPALDVDAAVETILWKEARAYRVAITVGNSHVATDGQKELFEGYENVVAQDVSRRRAEILHLTNLRVWMETLATKAKVAVDTLVIANV